VNEHPKSLHVVEGGVEVPAKEPVADEASSERNGATMAAEVVSSPESAKEPPAAASSRSSTTLLLPRGKGGERRGEGTI
jgi:hypothetical protein